ncbi:hypothetical protein SFLOR_v1c09770 [Spiroplasma floricola 23-6]|uniref:Uncharacterized protein n=1 Tax=Spiroplasma floricola 23-6 TaxID=1336749 RepID=A0A2K8SFA0_9MOLU|nr:hypothetical protein SFLOR_v1c09770 [Spiroplasma floricola 23-6]
MGLTGSGKTEYIKLKYCFMCKTKISKGKKNIKVPLLYNKDFYEGIKIKRAVCSSKCKSDFKFAPFYNNLYLK